MAGEDDDAERSQDPTQKRLDEALERGDVVKSQEVNTWFVIAGATLLLWGFGSSISGSLQTTLGGVLANAHMFATDGRGLLALSAQLGRETVAAIALPLLLLALAAIMGNMIQHRLVWSTEALQPKLSKI